MLPAARPGRWDRGAPLRVRLSSGALASAADLALLNGANLMAIGDGSSDRWELFQFSQADLVAPLTYDLSRRLRGQAGTDGPAASWPVGSAVVLMNGALQQVELPMSARGLARTWRIGAAARGFDDPAVVERVEAFAGIGLRPLSPSHLRARVMADEAVGLRWTRRSRMDADSWEGLEVPLGEDREAYLLRIRVAGAVVREVEVSTPEWVYQAVLRAADGASAGFAVEVAQLSDRFGPGLFRHLEVA